MTASTTVLEPPTPGGISMACVTAWESCYRWYHDLTPVGPLLLVGREYYRGSIRTFPDRTTLIPGDVVGSLHLNNLRLAKLSEAPRHQMAWQFGRLLRASLAELARLSREPGHSHVSVFRGKTWMRSHGLKAGFVTEPLPDNWRTSLLRWQFGVLRACFAPAGFSGKGAIEPRLFWITRAGLQEHFLLDAESSSAGEVP